MKRCSSSAVAFLEEEVKRGGRRRHHLRGWPDLPWDLVAVIARKASTPGDHARLSAACRSWREAAAAAAAPRRWDVPSPAHFYESGGQVRPLLPLVLDSHSHDGVVRGGGGGGQSQEDLLDLPAPMCICIGASRGLLLFYDSFYRLFLLDPRAASSTPVPQPHFPQVLEIRPGGPDSATFYYPQRNLAARRFLDCPSGLGVTSYCPRSLSLSSSNPRDCVALCYYPALRSFIYWRSGLDDRWSLLPCQEPLFMADAVHHSGGRFYIVDGKSFRAFVCDIGPSSTAAVQDITITRSSIEAIKEAIGAREVRWAFLVECRGDLLLAVWSGPRDANGYDDDEASSSVFNMFRLDNTEASASASAWVEQTHLGGSTALVLGLNESFSVSTRDFPGFEPNCLYVSTCISARRRCDYFIYRLDSRTVETVYHDRVQCSLFSCWTYWIAPRDY